MTHPASDPGAPGPARGPWPGLWALAIGFFMVLVDVTIVSVANPAIKAALDPGSPNLDRIVWVTSAYLLAYAVPLLITGRLGDRFGPKNVYLVGLTVFTLSSLWCGLSTSLGMLIAARAVQGLGAAMLSPQTMAVITRTFPAARRGVAMGVWGSVAGVATLVGPLLGGVLVDAVGWEWIFFVNVPVGVVAFVLAWVFVPRLATHPHRFDVVGVVLSAVALFLIVFGLQEGAHFDWGTIAGPVTVWGVIAAGVVVLVVFLVQQSRTRSEPLVPLALFRVRTFAVSSLAIATVGFMATGGALPTMFYFQLGRGLTPTQAALLTVPTAVLSGTLAPLAGRLLDRTDPRRLLVPGLALVTASILWYSLLMGRDVPTWQFLLPAAALGIGSAGMWGPLATTATRHLPLHQAGAGAGIYNTTRTVGSVVGSAAVAALMQSRLAVHVLGDGQLEDGFQNGALPDAAVAGFAQAMADTMLLPAAVIAGGLVAVLFLRRPQVAAESPRPPA